MRDCRDALGLEIGHCLRDLVAEIDSADTLVSLLDAGRLAVNLDLEPDAPDASRLHGEIAGLAGDTSVRLVAADHRIERAMAADLLVNDDVDQDIALRRQA